MLRPPPGMTPYVSSKMAIIGLTRGLAVELGNEGVTVNCIAPGLVPTQTVLQGEPSNWLEAHVAASAIKRVERPEDLVGALVFLVSDDAAFLTGQTLLVDGGRGFL
jgi:NAD(P)-dependent dehydrogenase (short-subunit alcohol dehydrogenase family)